MTGMEKLQAAINKTLDKYADDVRSHVGDIAADLGKQAARAINANAKSAFGGTGDYAKSWKAQRTDTRTGTAVVVYSTMPGLPHLLENGHAKRGGGRVEGRPHIAPVEDEVCAEFENAVVKNL